MYSTTDSSLTIEQAFRIAADHHQSGRLQQAEEVYRKILQVAPRQADTHHNLGLLARQLGQDEGALPHLQIAFEESPSKEQHLLSYTIGLLATGQTNRAYEVLTIALSTHTYSDAVDDLLQKVTAAQRNVPADRKEPTKAELEELIALFNAGDYEKLENKTRWLVSNFPDSGLVWKAMGASLQVRKLPAETAMRKAVEYLPEDPEALGNLATELRTNGKLEESLALYYKAIEIAPKMAMLHHNLAGALCAAKDFSSAVSEYKKALEIDPKFAIAHAELGAMLCTINRHAEGLEHLRAAVAMDPRSEHAHSTLLFSLGMMDGVSKEMLFTEHRRYSERFERPLQPFWPKHQNDRSPTRVLRVGFVSGDLRNHSVANFFEPLLLHLVQSKKLDVYIYYNHPDEDFVSARIKSSVKHWKRIPDLTDEQLAQQVLADGIDVLIDLSGHTGLHRLLTFARKPAPVQVSWIGYAGTTGLNSMDYYFTDKFFAPAGILDDQFSEKLVRIPAAATFLPFANAPEVAPLPALTNGHVTFGSFNRPIKIRREVISLWAKVLRSIPDSRMILAGMASDEPEAQLSQWFAEEGVSPDRLSFYGVRPVEIYMALHHQMDICLDTFPYNGGTTTWHAIWMGVPTLTLAGHTPVGRSGACILGQMGLQQFVAHSYEDFVEKAITWANQHRALDDIRSSMRQRFRNSAAGNPALVAMGIEVALCEMWQRYCSQQTPAAFEVTAEQAMIGTTIKRT